MPDPNITTVAAGLAWTPSEVVYENTAAESSPARVLLLLNTCGLLMGYYAMPNQWFQLSWFICMSLGCLFVAGVQPLVFALRRDVWLRSVMMLFAVMVVRASIFESPGMGMHDLWFGWLSCGVLMGMMMIFWQVGTVSNAARIMSTALAATAVVAALGSMAVFYVFDENAVFGLRLTNWFVYGGWNSVCTGITFGFAAIWSVSRWHQALKRFEKIVFFGISILLIWATLLSMSRGALLALLAGHLALVLSRGWRFSLRPLLMLFVCVVSFQVLAPQISKMGVRDLSEQMASPKLTEAMAGDGVIASNPAKRLIARGDSHRFSIYAAGFASMTTTSDWIMGKGLWATNDSWSCSLPWNPEHLHSVFVDTLVRGGVISLIGLIGLLLWALYRAWWLAQHGEEVWIMLSCFGIAGLIFDGDSAFSFLSVPRFEALILWVPLVLASVRYTVLKHEQSMSARLEQTFSPLST